MDAAVVLVVERWDDEHEEAHEEADLLHHLAAVKLVVDQERCQIVAAQTDAHIDQVPQPSLHDVASFGGRWVDDLDEGRLEQFVSVEENIVTEPATSSANETRTEVLEGHLEGVYIISSNLRLLLGEVERAGCEWHLEPTVVDQPEGANGWDGEGDSESPLRGNLGVWW